MSPAARTGRVAPAWHKPASYARPKRDPAEGPGPALPQRAAIVVATVLFAACGSFEDPSIVLDFRILAMTAQPPEQVVPIDVDDPTAVELAPVELCALISDQEQIRAIEWSMTACRPRGDRRCDDPEDTAFAVGAGVLDDPETASTPQRACATLEPGPELAAVLQETIANDDLSGFGGVDVNVMLRAVPAGAGEDDAVYGAKAVRFSPLLPADRVANANPTLDRIEVDRGDGVATELPLGRCADQPAPLELRSGASIGLLPVEPAGAREDYVVPTFDGGSRAFTEYLRYQWLAGDGDWSGANTGGPRDVAGNQPELDTEWRAPNLDDGAEPALVPLWVIQRDERGGGAWFESCARVSP